MSALATRLRALARGDAPLLLLLALALAALYRTPLAYMIGMWRVPAFEGADYSHGPFLPLVSAYALWRDRRELLAAPRRRCPWALALAAALLALHAIGARAEFHRLSLLSLVGLLWSCGLYLYGPAVARRLAFPAGFLIFCVPLNILDVISFRLRLVAATLSAGLLNGLGIPALRSGTAIYSAAGGQFAFDVADPCSGIRSLLALTALAAAYAHFTQDRVWRFWALLALSVPIAMLANVARVVTIALVAQAWGVDAAMKLYHDYSGYLVFVVATLLLTSAGSLLGRLATHPRFVGSR
jgi:exosortase